MLGASPFIEVPIYRGFEVCGNSAVSKITIVKTGMILKRYSTERLKSRDIDSPL